MRKYSMTDVKNRLPAILREVESEGAVELTRRATPVAVLVSIGEYCNLAANAEYGTTPEQLRQEFDRLRTRTSPEEADAALDKILRERKEP